jgi:hypothetical protein
MSRLSRSPASLRRSSGVALISVIMVMLVLSLMATYLVESLSGQYAATGLSQLTAQTEAAAASGVEWGRDRALRFGLCGTSQFQVGNVTVDVSCATQLIQEDADSYDVYDISVDARYGAYGNWDHVRRSRSARYASR